MHLQIHDWYTRNCTQCRVFQIYQPRLSGDCGKYNNLNFNFSTLVNTRLGIFRCFSSSTCVEYWYSIDRYITEESCVLFFQFLFSLSDNVMLRKGQVNKCSGVVLKKSILIYLEFLFSSHIHVNRCKGLGFSAAAFSTITKRKWNSNSDLNFQAFIHHMKNLLSLVWKTSIYWYIPLFVCTLQVNALNS